jgi:hypothetical protein
MAEVSTQIDKEPSRWRIYVFVGVVIYFIAIHQVIPVRPDHIFLALIILTLAFGKSRARKFLIDWLPFVIFWILYDMMRGVADSWRGIIHIKEIYDLELSLFGGIFGGKIPAFFFQDFQAASAGKWFKSIFDLLASDFYTVHFGAPLVCGWVLWHTTNDREMFYRFAYTLTLLNILALTTFFLFPVAPPWYVMNYGFAQPTGELTGAAGSLVAVDKMLRMKFFTTLWNNFNPNYFAAMPSLHGSYPIVVVIFIYKKFHRFLPLLVLYPLGVWVSSQYLNHHYVVDLIAGGLYVIIAYYVTDKILFPHVFKKTVFRSGVTLTFPEKAKVGQDDLRNSV